MSLLWLALSVSAAFASDCASDPDECTPQGLCEVATEVTDGNKLWSSAATSSKHVSFAQELGMNCGVVELKDPCDTDPNQCKINQLCEKATIEEGSTKSWNSEAEAYVEVAQEYGLECGVDQKAFTENCSNKNPKPCSDGFVCSRATFYNSVTKRKLWAYGDFKEEAIARGLECGLNCPSNAEACSNSDLCSYASRHGEWDNNSHPDHVRIAKFRGLTCGMPQENMNFRQMFISQSQLKRKQLQYALKEMGFYTYGVDGLWGKGTKEGFERFVNWANLEGQTENQVFRNLLSRVDVPSSFTAPKKTNTTNSNSNSNSNFNSSKTYYKGMRPLMSNPSTSAEQAWAICSPQAHLAGQQARRSVRPSSSSIDCDIIGRSVFCDKSGGGGGFWGGMNQALDESMAYNGAKKAVMASCLAQYGWKE